MEIKVKYAKPFEDFRSGWCVYELLPDGRLDHLDGPYQRREDAERSADMKRSLTRP